MVSQAIIIRNNWILLSSCVGGMTISNLAKDGVDPVAFCVGGMTISNFGSFNGAT